MAATLKKNAKGYGYKYTDIAEIHNYLEEMGYTYYQYIERIGDDDYIYTVPTIDGEEKPARRGCKILSTPFDKKSNPAQEQGSGITYARRYSLLMAFGLATTDDDGQCMTRDKKEDIPKADAEIVDETPKDKKTGNKETPFPSKQIMIDIAKKHYPEGSSNLKALLGTFNAESIEQLSMTQLQAIYTKVGGRA